MVSAAIRNFEKSGDAEQQPATLKITHLAIDNWKLTIDNWQLETDDWQLAIGNRQLVRMRRVKT